MRELAQTLAQRAHCELLPDRPAISGALPTAIQAPDFDNRIWPNGILWSNHDCLTTTTVCHGAFRVA